MKLIVGLGNPGKEYDGTRHNIGFYCLDKYLGNVKWSSKFNGLYYETNIDGDKHIFLKPQSYMNLSGKVVSDFKEYFKLTNEDILIIHDDLDLPVGKIRIKINSGSGGHNGIKDIILYLHDDSFARLKIGVSNNKNVDTKDYVLGKISKAEQKLIDNEFDNIKYVIDNFKGNNILDLMNKIN